MAIPTKNERNVINTDLASMRVDIEEREHASENDQLSEEEANVDEEDEKHTCKKVNKEKEDSLRERLVKETAEKFEREGNLDDPETTYKFV